MGNRQLTTYLKTALVLALVGCAASGAHAARLKDIAKIEGVRSNQLVGYGIVVGLDGTGDSQQAFFTIQGVSNMLERFGVQVSPNQVKMRNAASVIVTADLPAFAAPGTKLDVTVSSMGDCKSLQGGTLIQTPLYAANGQVYAAAQGPLSVGGFVAGGGGAQVAKNHVTAGRIPEGAIVEKAVETTFSDAQGLSILLNTPDFTTANRAADAINAKLGAGSALAVDAATVRVKSSTPSASDAVALIADIGGLDVRQDDVAKVIVNEKTGTVVISGNVTVGAIAVTQGELSVLIDTEPQVSQPAPFSQGRTMRADKTSVKATEIVPRFQKLEEGSTVDDLVRALNAMKVTPRDVISILQAIKQAGALGADLVVI
ncbi:MAG: flagellar basal body P-ring protein FlgI [Armatimonadetes bacterium]|nr:flagellar basal body P-ring protein FlgI [Armatimonadota bacterium]